MCNRIRESTRQKRIIQFAKWGVEAMNDFYIEYMVRERIREEVEECQRRRLLKGSEPDDLRSKILGSARSLFSRFGFEKNQDSRYLQRPWYQQEELLSTF